MSATTFLLIAWLAWGEKPGLVQIGGFAMIVAGAALVFSGK